MKLRLNNHHRTRLFAFMKQVVRCPEQEAALDIAYKTAAAIIKQSLEADYPPRHMKILEKYQASFHAVDVNFSFANHYDRFKFREGDGPLIPDSKMGATFPHTPEVRDAFEEWHLKKTAHEKALDLKYQDYRSIIHSCYTFESLVEIWPEVQVLAEEFKAKKALVHVNPALLARIQADVQSRGGEVVKQNVTPIRKRA